MGTVYRNLIRQQTLVAGLAFLSCSALSGGCLILLLILYYLKLLSWSSVGEFAGIVFVGPSVFAAFMLTLRLDEQKHMAWRFDTRLFEPFRSTGSVFLTILGIRLATLVALLGTQALMALTLLGAHSEACASCMAIPLYAYLLLQAEAWLRYRAPWISYAVATAFLTVLGGLRIYHDSPLSVLYLFTQVYLDPLVLTIAPTTLLLLMFFGVWLERVQVNFWPDRFIKRLMGFSRYRQEPASDFEALLRLEIRRYGRRLPLFTLGATSLFMLPILLLTQQPLASGFGQYLPLFALVLAAWSTGQYRFPRILWPEQQQSGNNVLASAMLLSRFQGLLSATLIAGVLSAILLWAGPVERNVLLNAREMGLADTLDLFTTVMRPLAAVVLLSWCSCWSSVNPVALVVVLFGSGFAYAIFPQAEPVLPSFLKPALLVEVLFVIAAASAPVMLVLIRVKKYISDRFLQRALLWWFGIGILFWLAGREIKGLEGVMIALGCASLAILPIPSLVWTLYRSRPAAGGDPWPDLRKILSGHRWLFAGALCLVVAFGLFIYDAHRESPRVRLLQARGIPTTMEEVQAQYPPAGEGKNGALLYIEAYEKVVWPDRATNDLLPFSCGPVLQYGSGPAPEVRNVLREHIVANKDALALISDAQQCSFVRNPENRYKFSERINSLGLLVLRAALDAAFEGDVETCCHMITAGLRMHEALEYGVLVTDDYTIRNQCRDALIALEQSLFHLQPPSCVLREWLGILQRDRYTNFLSVQQAIRNSGPEGFSGKLFYSEDERTHREPSAFVRTSMEWLQFFFVVENRFLFEKVTLADTANKDVYDAVKTYPAECSPVEIQLRYFPLFASTFDYASNIYHKNAIVLAKAAAAKVALASLLYLRDHGQLPDQLEMLVPDYLPVVPRDPYTREGIIRQHVSGDLVLFYSVGPDELDDGGATDDCLYNSGDIVFRLTLPQGER